MNLAFIRGILKVAVLLFAFAQLAAQDMHYTQFFNAPLSLNPALTGLTRGDYRVGAAYRGQWFGLAKTNASNAPYSIPSVFFDLPIHVNEDAIGLGAMFLSEHWSGNMPGSYTGCFSVSYIKSLGKKGNHQLSGGVQVGFTYKTVIQEQLKITSQFSGNNFYELANTQSDFPALNFGLVNLNAGLLWFGKINRRISLYAGGSVYNVVQPQQQFLLKKTQQWYWRWNVQTGVDITLGSRAHLLPCVMFIQHDNISQIMPGASVAFDVTPVATVSLGTLVRLNELTTKSAQVDATALYASFDYKGFKMGLSYDFTVAKSLKAANGLGAVEATMIYIGHSKRNKRIIFCPLF